VAILQGNAKQGSTRGFYPRVINGSLRFNDDDSAYLSRTPASAGNRKTFTFSAWVKRANIPSGESYLFSTGTDANNFGGLEFIGGEIVFQNYNSGTQVIARTGSNVFRDSSAWYHIVWNVDTTQTTAADRTKLYVNGTQVTSFDGSDSDLSLNYDTQFNNTNQHTIGCREKGSRDSFHDGYLAEVHFADGTAYTADAFGELKSGIWVPKAPSVTYGTNGFYLDFADGAAIGDDESGNGNDFTVNNLVASDVVLDSPTDNFATLNPLVPHPGSVTFSDGNLRTVTDAAARAGGISTIGVTSGKYYAEFTSNSGGERTVGVGYDFNHLVSFTAGQDTSTSGYGYKDDGNKYVNGTASSYGASYTNGDVIGVALDLDTPKVTFYKNGASQGDIAITDTGTFWFAVGEQSNGTTCDWSCNFGQQDFDYTPPSGFDALSTANLPDPAIDPAQDESPEDYFGVALYEGNESTNVITVGFQPDLVWTKRRNNTGNHRLVDSVRGVGKGLASHTTDAELSEPNGVTSFDTDGFTLGSDDDYNKSAAATPIYVGWAWKAGGSGVSNTSGSINSTVSASTEAGFSVVKYVGTQTAGDTVGHGLTQKPEMIIVKNLGYARNWVVYHKYAASDAETDHLHLNLADALVDSSADWDDTAPTSAVFSLGNGPDTNDNSGGGVAHIAYCFHSVDGFSRMGKYVGNGSSDGTFVYTGFRPSFVMVKRSDSADEWSMWDDARTPYNVMNGELIANSNVAESTLRNFDFVSNGFKLREGTYHGTTNTSGGTYIYMAFADQPFKFSNAR